jgi:hypothetical protein
MNPAEHSRKDKELHPERYCANTKCLWRIVTARGPNPCKNHPVAVPTASLVLTENR